MNTRWLVSFALLALVSACLPVQPLRPVEPTAPDRPASSPPAANLAAESIFTSEPTRRAFALPRSAGQTPIPPVSPVVPLPEGARVLLLAGQDQPEPYVGRSDFLTFFLYHPQSARVAIIPLPPDLFLYLPGHSMQRLSSAYALGGAGLVLDALDYNLGLPPDQYIFANLDDFTILIDELGGLNVPVSQDIPGVCEDRIHIGTVFMTGETALCYTSVREGADQDARAKRQMQILRLLLERFLAGGDLRRLPEFYSLFLDRLDTNLSARDVADAMPLLIAQADEDQQAAFAIGAEQTRLWQISDQPPATVFLPLPERVRQQLMLAAEFIALPRGTGSRWQAAAAQLSATPPDLTATATPTPWRSATPSPTGFTRTPWVWQPTSTPATAYPAPEAITPTTPPYPAP